MILILIIVIPLLIYEAPARGRLLSSVLISLNIFESSLIVIFFLCRKILSDGGRRIEVGVRDRGRGRQHN